MEYRAISKNIKVSPRKMRLVADGIKTLKIPAAITALTVLNKRAAIPVRKTLESALANATHNNKAKADELIIKSIMVGEGVKFKRYHFAGRGRMRPYKKRTSHITVVLSEAPQKVPKEKTQKKEVVEGETIK